MALFPERQADKAQAIGEIGFTNPFGPERTELDARILGRAGVRPSAWSRPDNWPQDDPILRAISEEAEALIAHALPKLKRARTMSDADAALWQDLALYAMYYRYEAKFFDEIIRPKPSALLEFYRDFVADVDTLFCTVPLPSWAKSPEHLFAIFFQTRRAFHFVFHQILGTSSAAANLRAAVWESVFTHNARRYLAHLQGRMHEVSTLIVGPSGTGKELAASAIAYSSFISFDSNKGQFAVDFRHAFNPVHIAAMPKNLVESELFGHKKGAFTGATADRDGHLEDCTAADTVFLDEIGELDSDVQVKLLRVLQAREFHRLGDSIARRFNGKIVAATHRDLAKEMAAGRFREDLYYRLCADVIETPPLQAQLADNPEELGHLASVLLQRALGSHNPTIHESILCGIVESVGENYSWPGNMRELEQCVRNLLVHGRYTPPADSSNDGVLSELFRAMERLDVDLDRVIALYLTWAYARTGSYSEAGELVGVDRRTVSKHLDREFLASLPGMARRLHSLEEGQDE